MGTQVLQGKETFVTNVTNMCVIFQIPGFIVMFCIQQFINLNPIGLDLDLIVTPKTHKLSH